MVPLASDGWSTGEKALMLKTRGARGSAVESTGSHICVSHVILSTHLCLILRHFEGNHIGHLEKTNKPRKSYKQIMLDLLLKILDLLSLELASHVSFALAISTNVLSSTRVIIHANYTSTYS